MAKLEAKAKKDREEGASPELKKKDTIRLLPATPVIEFKEEVEQPDFLIRLTFLLISISAQLNVAGKKPPSLRELVSKFDEFGSKFITHEQLQNMFKHDIPENAPYVQHTQEDLDLLALFMDPYKPSHDESKKLASGSPKTKGK